MVVQLRRTDPSGATPPRVGFAVGRAVGAAVVRNRTKRRLRALLAERVGGIPAGVDVVVRANAAAGSASFAQLGAEVDRLLARALEAVR